MVRMARRTRVLVGHPGWTGGHACAMITDMNDNAVHLGYHEGTVVLTGATPQLLATLPGVKFDQRTDNYRAEGQAYRAIVERLRADGLAYKDEARAWQPTPWPLRISRDP